MKIISWIIGLLIAYFASLYFLYFTVGVSIRSTLGLFIFLAAWSGFGVYMSTKHNFNGVLANWYSPFAAFNVKITAIVALCLTFLGMNTINKVIAWDLAWAIIPTIPIVLISLTLIKLFHGIALVRTIAMFATFQTLMILALCVFVFDINYQTKPLFEPKSSINAFMISVVYFMVTGLTMVNVYALRYFDFYQKMTTNQEKNQYLTHATKLKIAVHEAGHAMMYAYFKKVPEQLDILLYEHAMNKDGASRGLVIAKVPVKNSKEFREWELLLALAGTRAELIAYGKHSDGSESDIKKWQDMAHSFLTEFDSKYTNQPTTPANFHTNKRIETALFEKQTTIIDKFLKKNKPVMMKMAKQAMVFHRLESVHIAKHLTKVSYTTGFPREKSLF